MSDRDYDVVVIGGGIAGAAVAAHLAADRRVAVLEMEEQPGYHSTGRSAALFAAHYGSPVIRALTGASRDLLFAPPPDFSAAPLTVARKVLVFGREETRATFEAFVAHHLPAPGLERVDAAAALVLCPVLKADGLIGGVVERGAADIEVHALHQAYLRLLKRRGGSLFVDARANEIGFERGLWSVATRQGVFRAPVLVNAAGAWVDEVAGLAGVAPIGIEPRRRTAALIEVPDGIDAHDWPMIVDATESFYMKPDAGLLLISPADETLGDAGDAQPDELDVAIAADRVETFTTLAVRRIRSKWAGLRSFVADRNPVVGYDPDAPGFFWLAALGGYGIQTAPALSELAAGLVRGIAPDFAAVGITADQLSPARLTRHALLQPEIHGVSR
jgi:D-arginine dehydrogenase